MSEIHLVGIASALPQKVVPNSEFPGLEGTRSKMFVGSRERRHVTQEESSVDLFEQATQRLESSLGRSVASEVDAILTNVSLPDLPFTGCGAMLAQRLGFKPRLVLDLHNGGCVSFIVMMDFARGLMASHGIKNVLICTGQTAAGRIFSHEKIRLKPQSAIPGDGVSVALFSSQGDSPVEPILQHCHPEFASDMGIQFDDDRKYWQPGSEPAYLDFPEDKVASIIMRGNRLVPAVMHELLKTTKLKSSELDGLITNQPNPFFLRNWRESLELPPEKHFHSFEKYANLFQAGIPVNLDEAIRDGRIQPGNRVLLAGFSHAGDYSAAALLHWKKTS